MIIKLRDNLKKANSCVGDGGGGGCQQHVHFLPHLGYWRDLPIFCVWCQNTNLKCYSVAVFNHFMRSVQISSTYFVVKFPELICRSPEIQSCQCLAVVCRTSLHPSGFNLKQQNYPSLCTYFYNLYPDLQLRDLFFGSTGRKVLGTRSIVIKGPRVLRQFYIEHFEIYITLKFCI